MGLSIGKLKPQEADVRGRWYWFSKRDNARVLLARYLNAEHQRALRSLQRNKSVKFKPWETDDKEARKMSDDEIALECESMAEAVLLDFSGFDEEDTGEPIPYSKENARRLLHDCQYFRDEIRGMSTEFAAEDEDARVPLDSSNEASPGTSSGGDGKNP